MKMKWMRLLVVVILLVGVGFLVGACGDDDSGWVNGEQRRWIRID